MKKLLILFSLLSLGTFAQNKIQYVYDANGNRQIRQLVVSSPCNNCQTGRETKDQAEQGVQLATQHGLKIFPNPTQDKVTISITNLKKDEVTTILVTDASGRTMDAQENFSEQFQVDMTNYQQGIYFVKVTVGKDVLIYKIMKVQ